MATIVGFLSNLVFHDIRADYANFCILYGSAVIAVYYAAKRLFGMTSAVVAAIFFATEPLVIATFSVTYSEASVTYSAIAMAFAVAASSMSPGSRRTIVLVLAGFFWGTAVHSHLYSLTFNFAIVLYCLDWSRLSIAALLRDAAKKWSLLVVGLILATIFFGLVSVLFLHGSFLFFLRQFEDVATVQIVSYQKPDWYMFGGRGALMLLATGAAVAQSFYVARRNLPRSERTHVLTALIPFAAIEIAQLIYTYAGHGRLGGLSLEYDYYFIWLLAPLALLIASFVRVTKIKYSTITALGVYLIASLAGDFGHFDAQWLAINGLPLAFIVASALVVVFLFLPRSPKALLATALLLLAGLNSTIRPEKIGVAVWGSNERDAYSRLHIGMAFIAGYHLPKLPKFWINNRGNMWETVAYPRAFDYCSVDVALPNFISKDDPYYSAKTERFLPGDYLVMVPRNSTALAEAVKNLAARGLRFREEARTDVSYSDLSYLVVIGRLQ